MSVIVAMAVPINDAINTKRGPTVNIHMDTHTLTYKYVYREYEYYRVLPFAKFIQIDMRTTQSTARLFSLYTSPHSIHGMK